MGRLSALVRGRRRLVAGIWLLLVLASLPLMARQTENLTGGGFEVPGSGSAAVERQTDRFPGAASATLAVVLQQRGGDAAALRAAVERAGRAAGETEHVGLSPRAAAGAHAAAEAGRSVIVVPLTVDGSSDDALHAAADLREQLHAGEAVGGVRSYVVGQPALWAGIEELQKEDLAQAEAAGLPVVLIVLLAVFGSLLAALLPIGLGAVAVIVTGAVVYLLSFGTTMSIFVTNVASMVGIGVAVDYSLFLLSRYREEIAAGADRAQALDTAMSTSGSAVVFSGMTVVLSLAGLFLIDATVMRSMAIGAIVVVSVAVLASVTLLPALIALLGPRAERRGRVVGAVTRAAQRRRRRGDFWRRWTAGLMRRPGLYAAIVTAVLLLLAIPALSLQFGDGALAQFPPDHETRQGAQLAARQGPAGASSPTVVVVDFERGSARAARNRAALERYAAGLRATDGIAAVGRPRFSRDGGAAMLRVVSADDPESDATRELIRRMRAEGGAASGLGGLARISVGGPTADNIDFVDLVAGDIWKIFAFVIACSYLILLVVLRSVLLPLKAVLMNALTVGAAYGVLVAFFQYGWLDGPTGYDSLGYINSVTPPLLLAIVFGLSMDYEVFLLSRIRERWLATGDNRRAVAEGLEASAGVITSAALIMVAVFATFALTGVPQIKEIGVGLAVAIALDATLVRLVLVPAAMGLMGDWNWWLPGWLERLLPRVEIEGAAEERAAAAA